MSKEVEPKVKATLAPSVNPKIDDKGRLWRELRCLFCRHWFGDEYIREGRIRLKCPRCDKITLMEFRLPRRPGQVDPSDNVTTQGNAKNG